MKFLHLTDIHYLIQYPIAESGYLSIFNEMTHPIEQLKKGLSQVKDFDAVLISGDLVEEGDAADYGALREMLEHLFGDIPVIVTLGNHDIKPEFYEGWFGVSDRFKPYHHCVVLEDTLVICLDNSHPSYPHGIINEESCAWLEATLATCESQQIILMMHHHLIEEQMSIPPCVYDESFVNIIEKSNIDMIISGHTHHAYNGEFAGKLYFTADNLSFSGEDTTHGYVRFEERSGFNYCELSHNKVKVETIEVETSRKLLGNVTF